MTETVLEICKFYLGFFPRQSLYYYELVVHTVRTLNYPKGRLKLLSFLIKKKKKQLHIFMLEIVFVQRNAVIRGFKIS